MKGLLYSILLLLVIQSAFGQKEIEKLNSELKIARADSIKIKILQKIAAQVEESDPDKALTHLKEALMLAEKTKNEKAIGYTYFRMGIAYRLRSDFQEAIKYNELALQLAKKLNRKVIMASILGNLSICYESLGNYELAVDYGLKGLRIYEENKNLSGMFSINNNLATLYFNRRDLSAALKYFKEALKIAQEQSDSVNLATVHGNLASVYFGQNKHEEGLSNAIQALKIRELIKDTIGMAYSDMSLGIAYYKKKDFVSALKYYQNAIKIAINSKNKYLTSICYFKLAEISHDAGVFNDALAYLNKGYAISKELKTPNEVLNCYHLYSDIYEKKQDYRSAHLFQKLWIKLNDSIFAADKNKQIVEMQTKYETEKKEKEIAGLTQQTRILTQENKIQNLELSRNWYVLIGLVTAIILILVIAFLLSGRNKLRSNQTKMQVEQKLFRSQMNPHFIFNSLIAIQNYVYKHEASEVAKYISNFAKLMRMILENSRNEYVTIEKELSALKYYLELQQLRFQDKFDFSIDVDPLLDIEAISIPPMLSQPFIENAIEHGIMNKADGKGKISINFKQENNMVEMTIEDNGIGRENSAKIKSSQHTKHVSLATTITEERLMILNKNSKQKFTFNITDLTAADGAPNGTSVCIRMPES